jgi:hypothetical protein
MIDIHKINEQIGEININYEKNSHSHSEPLKLLRKHLHITEKPKKGVNSEK